MNLGSVEKTIQNLSKNEFEVTYFGTKEEASDYLTDKIKGKNVGFGDSKTIEALNLYQRLSENNVVYDPVQAETDEEFIEIGKQALNTDVFLLSVNGMSEDGQLVNIDGTGNRIAGSLFGHEKVYFVAGINKIRPTLEDAIHRARNIAAPMDTMKLQYKTPCAAKGERCYDCHSEERICNALTIYMQKMNDMEMEVVLIGESLGF